MPRKKVKSKKQNIHIQLNPRKKTKNFRKNIAK